ncbi:traf-type zinc finger family protein [Stylonychia lemnae]|uniref:Traf-type zinc finger family protein n=1 Tax=Stylonychia lemnae TaxID=5949 RepID=A0A077ZVI8_STYLE|nr:traf-type zinc finger family protein [Stylonychia lemnae]|eukprot:CDW73639.1 traf-type zinc finger family protein [Stylonychia lemnae]
MIQQDISEEEIKVFKVQDEATLDTVIENAFYFPQNIIPTIDPLDVITTESDKSVIEKLPREAILIEPQTLRRFICPSCKGIFQDPSSCHQCGSVFCSACILKNKDKHGLKCPNCNTYDQFNNKQYFVYRQNKISINQLFFTCHCQELNIQAFNKIMECKVPKDQQQKWREMQNEKPLAQVYSYQQYIQHFIQNNNQYHQCDQMKIKCPLQCNFTSNQGEKVIRKRDLKDHLKNECNEMHLTCQQCHLGLKRKQIQLHDCIRDRSVFYQHKNQEAVVSNNNLKNIGKNLKEIIELEKIEHNFRVRKFGKTIINKRRINSKDIQNIEQISPSNSQETQVQNNQFEINNNCIPYKNQEKQKKKITNGRSRLVDIRKNYSLKGTGQGLERYNLCNSCRSQFNLPQQKGSTSNDQQDQMELELLQHMYNESDEDDIDERDQYQRTQNYKEFKQNQQEQQLKNYGQIQKWKRMKQCKGCNDIFYE